MGSLQQLAIESFSYRWLLNLKKSPSFDDEAYSHSLDDDEETSPVPDGGDEEEEGAVGCFIEMDPKTERASDVVPQGQDFYFSLPSSESPDLAILDADRLFSNGLIMPLQLLSTPTATVLPQKYRKGSVSSSSDRLDSLIASPPCPPILVSTSSRHRRQHHPFFRRCRRSSKMILSKYLGFLKPLYRQVVRGKRCPSGIGIIICGNSSSSSSPSFSSSSSPSSSLQTTSIAFEATHWSRTHDSSSHMNTNVLFDSHIESSIYEAVLYCKKSIIGID